jgi:Uma2 family endonuclease
MATKTTPRKFSVEEFYKLAEVGVLSEDDRVELLDGQIMVMSPIGESHRTVTTSFNRSDFVSPLAFPDIRIRLDDLLP